MDRNAAEVPGVGGGGAGEISLGTIAQACARAGLGEEDAERRLPGHIGGHGQVAGVVGRHHGVSQHALACGQAAGQRGKGAHIEGNGRGDADRIGPIDRGQVESLAGAASYRQGSKGQGEGAAVVVDPVDEAVEVGGGTADQLILQVVDEVVGEAGQVLQVAAQEG